MSSSSRHVDRTTSVVLLIVGAVLAHVAAFVYFGWSWFVTMPRPLIYLMYWNMGVRVGDELIVPAQSPDGSIIRFRSLNLKTGFIRDTNLPFLPPFKGLIEGQDRIWIVFATRVVEYDGAKSLVHTPRRALNSSVFRAFLHMDRPAIIDLDYAGKKYRLYAFEEGRWIEGDEVAIPGERRTWRTDDASGRTVMEPCMGSAEPTTTPSNYFLNVVSVGDSHHLFFQHTESGKSVTSYREGLDLIPTTTEIPSALAPENLAADTTGWSRLPFSAAGWQQIFADRDQLIAVIRQIDRSELPPAWDLWEKPLSPAGQAFRFVKNLKVNQRVGFELGFFQSADRDRIYAIHDYGLRVKTYEFRDAEFQEVFLSLDSNLDRIVRWLTPVIQQLIAILSIGSVLAIASAEWIARNDDGRYEFGTQSHTLSAIWRRSVARCIDLALILLVASVHVWKFGVAGVVEIVNDLRLRISVSEFSHSAPLQQSLAWAIGVFLILVIVQANWGLTPGKWLCGIRVMRSTLRPSGLARSLLRELTFFLDVPLLLTALPGIASMLLNPQRQRIGDRLGDTVVLIKADLSNR